MQLKNYTLKLAGKLLPMLAAGITATMPAQAQMVATKVLGQSDLYSANFNSSAATAADLYSPQAVTSDTSGNLYVADRRNRVLIYKHVATKANGADADFVLGQPDFTTIDANLSATGLNIPSSLFIDPSGNLYVGDYNNNRVLIFKHLVDKVNNNTLTNGSAADYVLGQTTFDVNYNSLNNHNFWSIGGIAMDAGGDLYVVDYYYQRILMFPGVRAGIDAGTFVNGMAATKVLGQPDFTTGSFTPDPVSDHTFANPKQIIIDSSGNLYLADRTNNRVLRFNDVVNKPNGAAADVVLGQPDFVSNGSGSGLNQMFIPSGLAMTNDQNLLVSELVNFRVDRFFNPATITSGSAASSTFGQIAGGPSPSSNGQLASITIVPGSGTWVADQTNHRVILFDNLISLPLGLLTFTANKNESSVLLRWTIDAEQQPGSITLQRSADGNNFSTLTTIATNGNTAYNYTDVKPLDGRSYYRLQVNGRDGKSTYSEARIVNAAATAGNMPQAWPSPVTDVLHVSTGNDVPCKVWLCDMGGRTMVPSMDVTSTGTINMAGLPAGIYLLHIGDEACLRVVK